MAKADDTEEPDAAPARRSDAPFQVRTPAIGGSLSSRLEDHRAGPDHDRHDHEGRSCVRCLETDTTAPSPHRGKICPGPGRVNDIRPLEIRRSARIGLHEACRPDVAETPDFAESAARRILNGREPRESAMTGTGTGGEAGSLPASAVETLLTAHRQPTRPNAAVPGLHSLPMAPPLPIPESYWVVPGILLAGEYPFSYVEEEGRARLRAFLDAGIRLFVDLTEARESGRTGALEPYVEALEEEAAARGVSVRVVRHPVRDMGVPSDGGLERIVAELEKAVARREPAYVHCWGGIGRTGTAVAAFLSRLHGVTGEEALALLDEHWRNVPKSAVFPDSPQTEEQRRAVRRFAPARVPAGDAATESRR